MSNNHDDAIRGFLLLLATALVGAAAESFLSRQYSVVTVVLCVILGVMFFFAAAYWDRLKPRIGYRLTASIEAYVTNFKTWLVIAALLLVSTIASSLIQRIRDNEMRSIIRDDIPALYAAMKAYVLPRSLTPTQIASIGKYLSGFEPYEITINVIENDSESSSYRADLHQALVRGGWSIKAINDVAQATDGLSIGFQETSISAQARDDPRNPKANKLLQQALMQAGVQVDGAMTGGSGGSITTNSVSITIGHRRRDKISVPE